MRWLGAALSACPGVEITILWVLISALALVSAHGDSRRAPASFPKVIPYRVCGPLRLACNGWPLTGGKSFMMEASATAMGLLEWQARRSGV